MATELRKITQLKWRSFLASPEGQEGMLYLRENSPRVQKGAEHEMVFDSGRVEGYALSLDRISEVIGVEKVKIEDYEQDQLK